MKIRNLWDLANFNHHFFLCDLLKSYITALQVNASDNRGKADAKIFKGIGGCAANSIKELVSNEALTVGKDWWVILD